MKFLIPTVPGPKVNQSKMKTYRVVGTDLCFHVLRGGRDGNQVLIEYLDPYHEESFVKNFEEFFEKLPQGAKEELVSIWIYLGELCLLTIHIVVSLIA